MMTREKGISTWTPDSLILRTEIIGSEQIPHAEMQGIRRRFSISGRPALMTPFWLSGTAVDIGAYEYQEGPPSLGFILEYSSDLVSWESIDVGSAWQWLDEKPDGVGRRFYRIGVR
jgi:hypothetical protein